MLNRVSRFVVYRLFITLTCTVALASVVACGATAPTESTVPAPETAPVAQPAASTSGDSPAPTAVPAQANEAAQTADRGKYGGIVPMHDYAFPNLIWHPHEFSNQFKNNSAIYNGLIEYNAETDDPYDIRGDLAESWELQPDGVTYVFHLHENAMWHDGTPVTAVDVVHSMDSLVNTDVSRPQTLIIAPYYSAGNARVIDDYTVEIQTNNPAPDFIPMS